ncbi:MAG: GTPase [Eubacteriales bacterium]
MEIPVYLFTGFLEGGKTKVIQETLQDEGFNAGERFLLLVCEEGIEEYDPTQFAFPNVFIETLEDPSMLTPGFLESLQKKHDCERVIIEYNGMWMLNDLYQNLPDEWMVYQEMFFADYNSFLSYNANMRQLVFDKLQSCETVVFNRTPEGADQTEFHKIVRGINKRCNIAYEYENGEFAYDEIEDPLPFDIDAPIIEIKDEDYAIWYRDLTDEPAKYAGKTVRFKGIVATDPKLGKTAFAIGRHVMTCCASDISYCAMVCKYSGMLRLKTRDWVIVTAKIAIERHSIYEGNGPVLYANEVVMTSQPEQPVSTFY